MTVETFLANDSFYDAIKCGEEKLCFSSQSFVYISDEL